MSTIHDPAADNYQIILHFIFKYMEITWIWLNVEPVEISNVLKTEMLSLIVSLCEFIIIIEKSAIVFFNEV